MTEEMKDKWSFASFFLFMHSQAFHDCGKHLRLKKGDFQDKNVIFPYVCAFLENS